MMAGCSCKQEVPSWTRGIYGPGMKRSRQFLYLLFGGATLLACPSAQARVRDDVMSGSYRCAVIAESRQWLDCYYGAAQPMRAALGLKPAPTAQTGLSSSPPSGPGQPGDIPVRDAVMSAAAGCTHVGDDRQWLDCYYAAAQSMRATLHLSPAPQTSPAMPMQQAAGMHAASEFGKEAASPAASINRVQSRMVSYKFNALGTFTVTLENGQVWQQVEGDTDHAHWNKPAPSYVVTIKRGFLKSYNFQVQGLPGLYKVLRIS